MMETVETDPSRFHLKNRGIMYLCEKFEFENATRTLRLTIPDVQPEEYEAGDDGNGTPKFGIADGGHTFEVIRQTSNESTN